MRKQESCLEKDNATNNARCTQTMKTTHGLDGQHQYMDRTPRETVNQNDRGQEINGESTSMVWPTLRSKTAKEQNRTSVGTWLAFSLWIRSTGFYRWDVLPNNSAKTLKRELRQRTEPKQWPHHHHVFMHHQPPDDRRGVAAFVPQQFQGYNAWIKFNQHKIWRILTRR